MIGNAQNTHRFGCHLDAGDNALLFASYNWRAGPGNDHFSWGCADPIQSQIPCFWTEMSDDCIHFKFLRTKYTILKPQLVSIMFRCGPWHNILGCWYYRKHHHQQINVFYFLSVWDHPYLIQKVHPRSAQLLIAWQCDSTRQQTPPVTRLGWTDEWGCWSELSGLVYPKSFVSLTLVFFVLSSRWPQVASSGRQEARDDRLSSPTH